MSLGQQPSSDSAQSDPNSANALRTDNVAARSGSQRNDGREAYGSPDATHLSSSSSLSSQTHAVQLTQFIRGQVIPRLAQAHGLAVSVPSATPSVAISAPIVPAAPSAKDVSDFADLAFQTDSATVVARIEALVATGVSMDRVYLDWVAPAARQLGCDWDTDRANFSEVTLGLWRLQQSLHALSPKFHEAEKNSVSPRRALLVSAPKEQHTLGLFMLSEFFRRAGWDVWSDLPSDYSEVAAKVGEEWYDLVGISVGSEVKLEALTVAVTKLRHVSRNPDLVVMVGGPIFVDHPEFAIAAGADFTAQDAPDAVSRGEKAVSARTSEQYRR